MSSERIQRGLLELDQLADRHGLGQRVSRQMARAMASSPRPAPRPWRLAQALTAIGPEELGRLMYAARAIDDLRQFVDLATAALEVAEKLAIDAEAEAGRDLLSGSKP